jgi:hypothetical protein
LITEADVLDEPLLEFRYGQAMVEPHDGLAAFGPYDGDLGTHPDNISIAVAGTTGGTQAFRHFSEILARPIPGDDSRPSLWPTYPGFEAIFDCRWPARPTWEASIDSALLNDAVVQADAGKRVFDVVDLYLSAIEPIKKKDESFDLIVCIVPDLVFKNCRVMSAIKNASGEPVTSTQVGMRRAGQLDLFTSWPDDMYDYSLDFRNQLKARAMAIGIPIQIIKESTLTPGPVAFPVRKTPLSDRAWNIATTAYYKAGGKPWRLMGARDGVCYVGLAYRKKDSSHDSQSACCAAQMFLNDGDGVVFVGEVGAWYSPDRHQFHLDPGAARRLLEGVLDTYREQGGKPLREVFLHANSQIDREEFEGFKAACPPGVSLVGVRVRSERGTPLKVFREGTRPVLRGTVWPVSERRAFLWGSGFKLRLGTYDGKETPVPLRIEVQHGDADIGQVARDILALTKLNYNACRLGAAMPVTVGYSQQVGEILVSNPTIPDRRSQFKFYI